MDVLGYLDGARGRNRTGTAVNRGILSPLCLPISPPGRGRNCLEILEGRKHNADSRRFQDILKRFLSVPVDGVAV